MSDLYSDLNLKEGTKIVLGESGVSISSSGSVVLDSGCTTSLGDIATKAYIDSCLSGVVTTEDFSCECVAGAAYLDGERIDVCAPLIIGSGTACVALSGADIHLEAMCNLIVLDAQNGIQFTTVPTAKSDSGYVNLATEKYVDEAISGLESSGGTVSGDYLPATQDESGCYYVEERVSFTSGIQFVCCSSYNCTEAVPVGCIYSSYNGCDIPKCIHICSGCHLDLYAPSSVCIASHGSVFFQQKNAFFYLPNKICGSYTLVVTDDTTCCVSSYPSSYTIYLCSTSSCGGGEAGTIGYCVGGIPTFEEGCGSGIYFCSNAYLAIYGCAGVSLHTGDPSHGCGYTTYVPAKFPYSPCSSSAFCATIVTSPGYDSSGCGLQICVLSQSDYDAMCEHGMTTLYFIKG